MAQASSNKKDSTTESPKFLKVSKVLVYSLYAWTLFGVILLMLRVFLLAFSANPSTKFVTFIYETSGSYLSPFRGIFEGRDVGATGYLDISSVFAIVMYLLFAWGVSSLISYVEHKIASIEQDTLTQETKDVNNNAHLEINHMKVSKRQ